MRTQAEFTLDTLLLEGKAHVEEHEDGDLGIEGYATDIGTDDEGDIFEPGAFERGVKDFITRNPILLYHHHNDQQLGKIDELEQRPDGLYMKATVAKPADSSPLMDVYNKIKRGWMRGLSVRGFFDRDPARPNRIKAINLREISVTPFPVSPKTLFAVAQKAYPAEGDDPGVGEPEGEEPDPATAARAMAADRVRENIERTIAGLGRMAEALGVEIDFDPVEGEPALEGKASSTTYKPWNGSPARFSDEQYRRSCVIKGPAPFKKNCHLPVREPDGTLNCRGVRSARGRLNQVKASSEQKAAARSKLERLAATCQRATQSQG